ncbi:MAG: alanine racemase [Candidatus Kapaibacterium sp.]|nr:MAG: alanine racemase [Candidatus Kapabacteria bacterium]
MPAKPLRSTLATIHLSRLRHNFRTLAERASASLASDAPRPAMMAVVKADAYGHGIVPCAKAILEEGKTLGIETMLGVAFAAEATPLRAAEDMPDTRIAVVTPPFAHGAAEYCRLNLEFCAASRTTMQAFSAEAAKTGRVLNAHLTLDTGMRRDGIQPHEALEFMRSVSTLPNINIHGICTHFATADEADKSYYYKQVRIFTESLNALRDAGFSFRYIHAANSGAIAEASPQANNSALFTLLRPGIALYGYNPSHELLNPLALQPVMSLTSSIISLRRLPKGEAVSYGCRYITPKETTIATIPIGYADGFRRGLTGKAQVIIQGTFFPVVGTICMDQCMVDISDEQFRVGDEVILLGAAQAPNGSENRITADDWATALGTIPYEICTGMTARVPRLHEE